MGWRFFHDFLKWIGVGVPSLIFALFMGAMALVAALPETKPWVVERYQALVAMNTVGTWCVAILAIVVWAGAFIYSGRKAAEAGKPDLATLAELLKPMLQSPVASDDEPAVATPALAHHLEAQNVETGPPQITSPELLVNEQTFYPPTVTQTSPEFPPGLYVGLIIIAAGKLADEHSLEIAIRAFNGTDRALRLVGIGGEIEAGETTRLPQKLPMAEWIGEHTPDPISPHQEFAIVLRQPVPEATAKEFLRVIESGSYVSVDLRAFNIEMAVADDANLRARLPLWDGAAMMRRDDVFTARIVMSTGLAFNRPVPSLKAVLTRADGTTEERND